MKRYKFSEVQISEIHTLLDLHWSYSVIVKHMAKKGVVISKKHITNIKNSEENSPKKKNKKKQSGTKPILTTCQVNTMAKMIESPDPPTQKSMATKFSISPSLVRKTIKKIGMKLVKKPKGHAISPAAVEKRFKRSWNIYLRLNNEKWMDYVTSDEVWFYLTDVNGKREVQYIEREKSRSTAEVFCHVSHPKGIMVWAAISSKGIFKPIFVEPGAKINASYYISNVLKPFIKEIHQKFPKWKFVFHQDSAPAHTAKRTLDFLKMKKMKFIPAVEWMPNSPDAAPCDFFLWGYLKSRLKKYQIFTIDGLKRAICKELKLMPQVYVDNALAAWPKRCRQIYDAKGYQIDRHR